MKIAILLAGQVRDWNACSKIFELYNSIYSDVEFNFFLATWDDKYDNVEYDMNSYSFITEYKFHDQKESLYTEQLECYAYLCKSANILKNKYAKKHSIKYDCVIATRPDIFLGLDLLSNIRDLLVRSNNYEKGDKFILNKNVVYTPTGTLPYRKTNKDGEVINIEELVGSSFVDLCPNSLGLYIPWNELINRVNLQWFVRLSPEQVLKSNTFIGKKLLVNQCEYCK